MLTETMRPYLGEILGWEGLNGEYKWPLESLVTLFSSAELSQAQTKQKFLSSALDGDHPTFFDSVYYPRTNKSSFWNGQPNPKDCSFKPCEMGHAPCTANDVYVCDVPCDEAALCCRVNGIEDYVTFVDNSCTVEWYSVTDFRWSYRNVCYLPSTYPGSGGAPLQGYGNLRGRTADSAGR